MCADVAVSKYVEVEDVENVALGVVLQCLVVCRGRSSFFI